MEVFDLRNEYTKGGLSREDLNDNPFVQFEKWFKQAQDCKVFEPNAMSVATVNKNNEPSIRTVLLKSWDERGFVFYTNYESAKATDIESNPNVSLNFFWPELERQIKICGTASKVGLAESIKYFVTRPFSSKLGAWVSNQSKIITSRKLLEMKFEEMKRKFQNGEVPLPDNWGGFRVTPKLIEFWQGRPSRLHDRFQYTITQNSWQIHRLEP